MKHKTGPKTETSDPVKRVSVTIDEMTQRKLRVLGEDNVSMGIRRAADYAYEAYQRGREVIVRDTAMRPSADAAVPVAQPLVKLRP